MVITPHMLVGTAIGLHSNNIWMAFSFGLISHYLMDFLPHWEYLTNLKISKSNKIITKLIFDFVLGFVLVLILIWSEPQKVIIAFAVFGALLPDFIQGIYFNFSIKQLKIFHRFHYRIHYWKDLSFWQGLPATLIVIIISLFLII